jgi:hypothetical protein
MPQLLKCPISLWSLGGPSVGFPCKALGAQDTRRRLAKFYRPVELISVNRLRCPLSVVILEPFSPVFYFVLCFIHRQSKSGGRTSAHRVDKT